MKFTCYSFLAAILIVATFLLFGQIVGCSTITQAPGFCESVTSLFTTLGQSVCQSLVSTQAMAIKSTTLLGETQTVVAGIDTMHYNIQLATGGGKIILWRTTSGLNGSIFINEKLLTR